MPESNSRRPIRYGKGKLSKSSGIISWEVRADGHPHYKSDDSITEKEREEEEEKYLISKEKKRQEEEARAKEKKRQEELLGPIATGPASLREKIRDVITKGPSTVKRIYFGKGKKNKTKRRRCKKRKTRRHKKTLRKSRRS